jgi:putative Holliday junction resolvase
MCIDYGEVRIGIALSDPLQIMANPYSVIKNNADTLFDELNQIIKSENVSSVILGLPLNSKGEDSEKTKQVREFAEILKSRISLPVEFWDESYSTVEANKVLKKMGLNTKKSRQVVDKVAASIILQDYLENRS